MSSSTDTVEIEKTKIKKPSKWVVILHNDDVTPMDFVIELLYYVFNLDITQATKLMLQIHNEGQGIAGVYSYEIAEQKYTEAQTLIKLSAQSLKITMEEE